MIKVNDEWGIMVDEYSYSPAKIYVKGKLKGKCRRRGYYATLSGAIEHVAEEMVKDKLANKDMSLKNAVETVKQCYAELREALPGRIE